MHAWINFDGKGKLEDPSSSFDVISRMWKEMIFPIQFSGSNSRETILISDVLESVPSLAVYIAYDSVK